MSISADNSRGLFVSSIYMSSGYADWNWNRVSDSEVGWHDLTYDEVLLLLTKPEALRSRSEVIGQSSTIPPVRGLYAWFFREVPRNVPVEDCITIDGLTLLYVGISPSNPNSTQHLRKRIRHHFFGNAEGSTLRQTLVFFWQKRAVFLCVELAAGEEWPSRTLGNNG